MKKYRKGGRPPIFSDVDKRIIFDSIRKNRNNNDANQYRHLQAHIDNNSTISEVVCDIEKRHQNVSNIWRQAKRRTKSEIEDLQEEVKDLKREAKENINFESPEAVEEVNVDSPEVIQEKEIDHNKARINQCMEELDKIKSDISNKKLTLDKDEHWEILKEYGVINLLNDYLNLYLYEKPDEDIVNQDKNLEFIPTDKLWSKYQEYRISQRDLEEKEKTTLSFNKEDRKQLRTLNGLCRRFEAELRRRHVKCKSTYTYVGNKDKIYFTDRTTGELVKVGAVPKSYNRPVEDDDKQSDIPETIGIPEEDNDTPTEYSGETEDNPLKSPWESEKEYQGRLELIRLKKKQLTLKK